MQAGLYQPPTVAAQSDEQRQQEEYQRWQAEQRRQWQEELRREQARKAQEREEAQKRQQEERRLAEEKRQAEEQARLAAEERAEAERQRQAAEAQRAEEQRLAAEAKRLAEEQRLAEAAKQAEAERIEAQQRQEEEQKLAAQKRQAEEQARLAAEERAEAERQRQAAEARRAEEQRLAAEAKRLAEDQRLAEAAKQAEAERIEAQQRQEEEQKLAAQKRQAEEQARLAAEERAEAERQRQADLVRAQLRLAEQQRLEQQQSDSRRSGVKNFDWQHGAYRESAWRQIAASVDGKLPWRWRETRYALFERLAAAPVQLGPVYDRQWSSRLPGLHADRWHDGGQAAADAFWYRGKRIHDAMLFYDDRDELSGVGLLWNDAFVFIRDNNAVYQPTDAAWLEQAGALLKRPVGEPGQRLTVQDGAVGGEPAQRWRRSNFNYNEPSPFQWHESRRDMRERFSTSAYRLEPIDNHGWDSLFPGLRSEKWHEGDGHNQGHFWYHGMRVREAALFYDAKEELVGVGFAFGDVLVFIRDDAAVYHQADAAVLGLALPLLKRL